MSRAFGFRSTSIGMRLRWRRQPFRWISTWGRSFFPRQVAVLEVHDPSARAVVKGVAPFGYLAENEVAGDNIGKRNEDALLGLFVGAPFSGADSEDYPLVLLALPCGLFSGKDDAAFGFFRSVFGRKQDAVASWRHRALHRVFSDNDHRSVLPLVVVLVVVVG